MGKKLDIVHSQLQLGRPKSDSLELLQRVEGETANHKEYIKSIRTKRLTFCLGPAGTGKTWQAIGIASEMLTRGKIKHILITRPMVPCGKERLGFLPGDKNAKVAPHMLPLLDAFDDFLGRSVVDKLIESEVIEMAALEQMRGRNIRDSVIVLDEAQNIEFRQLHMFLTRFAKGSRVIVTGDPTQTDLPYEGKLPLIDMMDRFRVNCREEIAMVTMSHSDVMRDELVQWIDRRALGLPDLVDAEQEEFCSFEELEQEPIPVYTSTCLWCGSECGYNDENPLQIECWACTSLTSFVDGRTVGSRATLREGVCSKTFEV